MMKRVKDWWRDEWFKADPKKYGHFLKMGFGNKRAFVEIPGSRKGKHGGYRYDNTPEWEEFLSDKLFVSEYGIWATSLLYYFSDPMDAIQAKLIFGD